MRERRFGKLIKSCALAVGTMGMITACHGAGDTDGGKALDSVGQGSQVVGDGFGATLSLDVPDTLTVGGTDEFRVTLKDPNGLPLEYVRVACESEKGIAILEPSSGGVAFEHTSANGIMSGVLGGVVPGSYIIECKAPDGYNLVVRDSIKISGPVPADFIGFPGAAGGNLGGGLLIDLTPDDDQLDALNGAVRIESVEFADGSDVGPNGPIDIIQSTCNNGTPADASDDFAEPFFFNSYTLTVVNDTTQSVFLNTVDMTVQDSGPSSIATQQKQIEIAAGSTGEVTGLFSEFQLGAAKRYAGSSDLLTAGTFRVDFVVTGVTQTGTSFSMADSTTLTFDAVNRCE